VSDPPGRPEVNGVNLVRLSAAADTLRRSPRNVALPAAALAEWLASIAQTADDASWGDDVPGLQLADQVAQVVVGDAPAPDLPAGQRGTLIALLTSGPIGPRSGERYIRADLIRAAINEPDLPGPPASDPGQPANAGVALARASNMHYRYCDDPADGCAGCAAALGTARAALRVLAAAGWHLIRLDAWADRARAAARAAHALRGPRAIALEDVGALPYLRDKVRELADAVADWAALDGAGVEDVEHLCDEAGGVAIAVDHIVDRATRGRRTLADVMEAKVGRDRARFPQAGQLETLWKDETGD